jgi:hypothetical protein
MTDIPRRFYDSEGNLVESAEFLDWQLDQKIQRQVDLAMARIIKRNREHGVPLRGPRAGQHPPFGRKP